jgi:hypothetical protein
VALLDRVPEIAPMEVWILLGDPLRLVRAERMDAEARSPVEPRESAASRDRPRSGTRSAPNASIIR